MAGALNFNDLFAKIGQDRVEKEKREQEEYRRHLEREHKEVSEAILAAHKEGKNWCIVRKTDLSPTTMKALKDHCVVTRYGEGVNPSTHDGMWVGWKLNWGEINIDK